MVQPNMNLHFEIHKMGEWQFIHSNYPMSNSKELDQVSDQTQTMGLPEVFYGNNHLYCVNAQHNFLFEICPVESVSLTSYAKREAHLRDAKITSAQAAVGEPEKVLNMIDLITEELEAKEAKIWKKKDVSKIKDFTTVEIISDWTYSSAYKGSVRFMTNHSERIKNQTSLQFDLSGIPGG